MFSFSPRRRVASKRIAICHQTITIGDAIGNDILGMYDVLEGLGFEPELLCQNPHEAIRTRYRTRTDFRDEDLASYAVIIYHHSLFWERGEALLRRSAAQIIMKYHNVTPPEFFEPYSPLYMQQCARGREQTSRLVSLRAPHIWLADSAFNRRGLLDVGARDDRVLVVPPFNHVDELLPYPNETAGRPPGPTSALFVGRLAPNKGHLTLLRIAHAYVTCVSSDFRLRIVGSRDADLRRYEVAIRQLIEGLGLERHVEILPPLPRAQLDGLFRTCQVYLCASEHEGFGVPLIEAQAVGLPVVATNTTAKGETLGAQQLLAGPPADGADYEFYARLIHEVCTNSSLRRTVVRNGYRNVVTRFLREDIENAFLEAVLPTLQAAA